MKKLSLKEKLLLRCRHFNGLQHKYCDHDVPYPESAFKKCFGEKTESKVYCCYYDPLNEQEAEKEIERHKKEGELLAKNLSICCESKLDTSKVIKEGRFKGHGPRFCSKCGKLVYLV